MIFFSIELCKLGLKIKRFFREVLLSKGFLCLHFCCCNGKYSSFLNGQCRYKYIFIWRILKFKIHMKSTCVLKENYLWNFYWLKLYWFFKIKLLIQGVNFIVPSSSLINLLWFEKKVVLISTHLQKYILVRVCTGTLNLLFHDRKISILLNPIQNN